MFEGDKLRPVLDRVTSKEPGLFVFMARFLPAKGGDCTIEAFSQIVREHPEARLVMAGEGPDRPRLEALVKQLGLADQVHFPGYVGGETKMELLARASVFVLPTAHPEGMPNAVLEAMAAGDVVVTTPVGGIPDVVEDGQNGAVLKTPDVKLIAQEMRRYLEQPALAEEVSARNREKAWRLWESGAVADRIADHYVSVLAET
jgi:glycosyltransferase involved in cell wall biosynthesis